TAGPLAAPSNLSATAISTSQINLAWTDNSSTEDGFKIEQSTDNVSFTQIATVGANVTTYSNSGLNASTTYYYRVRATSTLSGDSSYSNVASATPVAAPGAPGNLTATAGNAQVTLSWTAVSGATGYNVKRSTSSGGPYTTVGPNVTPTSFTDSGLTNSTTYYYVVTALTAGGESVNSAQVSATPVAAPGAPSNLTATAGNAQVALSWTAVSGATGYNVKPSTSSGGPYT